MTTEIQEHYERLRSYLTDDPFDVENGFRTVSMLQQEAAELAAQAIRVESTAKENVKIAEANAGARIREEYGDGIAQNKIESMLPKDPDVHEAKEVLKQAAYDAYVCKGLIESFKTRSVDRSKIVNMLLDGYFQPNALKNERRPRETRIVRPTE